MGDFTPDSGIRIVNPGLGRGPCAWGNGLAIAFGAGPFGFGLSVQTTITPNEHIADTDMQHTISLTGFAFETPEEALQFARDLMTSAERWHSGEARNEYDLLRAERELGVPFPKGLQA